MVAYDDLDWSLIEQGNSLLFSRTEHSKFRPELKTSLLKQMVLNEHNAIDSQSEPLVRASRNMFLERNRWTRSTRSVA